jgi:flagellar biosynthesis/type III secretory pathway M-ring protein FliF/YscJ
MKSFNANIDRVHAQLIGLSNGRKLLLGVLTAAVVAGGIWWGRLPAQQVMEPVLDQQLEPAQLAQITSHLSGKGVAFKLDAGKVLVSADKKLEVLADLLYEDLLPNNTESGFDAVIKQSSIWDSGTKLDHMYTRAKEVTLQSVISRFPGVKKATVLIDPTSEQHINGSVTPSALVDIQTRGQVKNARQLATAAVNAVLGAQSNLSRTKVQVTIDGAPCRILEGKQELAEIELQERIQQREQACVSKVRQQLSFIPDALISVSIPDAQPVTATATHASDTLVANTGSAAPAAQHAEVEAVMTASVAVPRSYFVKIYNRSNQKLTDPGDGLLQPLIDLELEKIRKLVKSCLAIRSDDDVTVECYHDLLPSAPMLATTATASMPIMMLVSRHTREVGIGAASVVALLLIPLLLRRGKPQASAVSSRPIHAALFNPRHYDELENERVEEIEDVDAHEPARQLQAVVQDDPDAAANLVERWISEQ